MKPRKENVKNVYVSMLCRKVVNFSLRGLCTSDKAKNGIHQLAVEVEKHVGQITLSFDHILAKMWIITTDEDVESK